MVKIRKMLSICLSLLIIISAFIPICVQGASESQLRSKVVSIAKDEVGYTGSSSYSKYGEWYGYQGGWCTTFVLWCFNEAGSDYSVKIYGNITPSGGNCNSMISWYSNKGQYYKRSSNYTPKAGDLVFFDWSGNGSSQHVGIVSGVSGSTIYTIEGNCSGAVKSRSYTTNGSKPYNNVSSIMGYAVPNYSSVANGSGQAAKTTTKKAATTKASTASKTKKITQTTAKSTTTSTTTTTEKTTLAQVELQNLSLRASSYELKVGDSVKLDYSIEPYDATAVVGYFCDEEGIIEIDSGGEITAIGSGTATVVVCANNDLYSQCDFTVGEAIGAVTTTQPNNTRKVVGKVDSGSTTQKSVQTVLTNLGVNVNALSQNRQLYIIPATIIAGTMMISIFVATVKKIKEILNENEEK